MDGNNWRANSGQAHVPGQVMGGEAPAAPGMDAGDWRTQLPDDSRQRIVNKIMDTLKRHLPFSGQEGLQELKKIAVRFEEKTYTSATSQSDYLRKISLKMLTMETKSQNTMAISLQSNAPSNSKNPQDPASQSMQPMVTNQSQERQQLLSQNIQNNIPSTGVPNSASLTSVLPTVGGMSQTTMPNVVGQNPNMQSLQNISSVTPNVVGNSMGQGVASNMFANAQRSNQGRQQSVVPQEQQQQSQTSQQYLYNQQLQQHLMNQKFQQGNISQSLMQSQIQQQQQQNLLQPTKIQSSQLMQPSLRQSATSSSLLQNQQSSIQQSTQPMLQQQSQSVLRQQPQQSSLTHQQQTSMPQHPILPTQQQQQLSGHQTNAASMQQNQLIGQQNNILDAQHQQQQQQQQPRMMSQQNNLSNLQQHQTIGQQNLPNIHQQQSIAQQNSVPNMHQQQIGPQSNVSGFQQQQMVGNQSGNSGMQNNQQSIHMLQPSKVALQQQMQQNVGNLLPNQAQQSQSQPPQQQMMSQIQSQPGQLQQQLGLQQQTNSLQRDMHQRIQTSGPLLQQHGALDQQKHLVHSQRVPEAPLSSLDSSSQTGNANAGDWQEEIFQKIRSMNNLYFPELNEMYQKMAAKLQQHDSLPQQTKNEQLEKLRFFKVMLERIILFLRLPKNEVQLKDKEKIVGVEKQIINILNSNKPRKPVSSVQQGHLSQPHLHNLQQSQQPQSQIHPHENQMNSQMQPANVHGSMAAMQQNNITNLQNNSLSSVSGIPNSRQNIMDGLQSGSNMDPSQGNTPNSLQQVAMGSLQQDPVSGPQQVNMNSISSHSGLTTMQSNLNPLQQNSNILPTQHVKQEQQMFPTTQQQVKQQFQQRHMQQQQYLQRQQQLMQQQQQQQHPQTNQQQSAQLASQQMLQLHQMNETNDMKMRQQMSLKSGGLQQHHSSGQRSSYHQPLKPGTPFSMSSPQVLQAASPQVGPHPSPQIDQQNLLASHPKTGTPLQSANSPIVVPSSSTSMAPSTIPGESDKMNSVVASQSNAGNIGHHQITGASIPGQSLAIGTPGISASPLLAEFISLDGTHGVVSTVVSGNSNVVEQPLDRLIKVVKSMSPKALSSSVSDISSVVSMIDRIAGSAPGNGSRAAVGEDLAAMTKCRLQARNFFSQDGSNGTKRMRRYTSAVPSNVVSSTGSVNDSFNQLNGTESDGESNGASNIKRPRIEANHALEEELREINERLIDTVVYISDEDVDPTAVAATAKGGDGTIVKCSFSAVALSPNLKSQYASAQMSPIQPLRVLVPNNYPNCSPILLDKFPVEVSKEYEDLSLKAKSRFSISLRTISQPMSLREIARTWDICARAVISEYAQQSGGGSFSSKYGTWENCLTTA